jgi:hypothetical protein
VEWVVQLVTQIWAEGQTAKLIEGAATPVLVLLAPEEVAAEIAVELRKRR